MKDHPIKVWREERKISQEEAAGFFGVSRWSINRIENGKYKPSIILSKKLSKLTGITKSTFRPDVWEKER